MNSLPLTRVSVGTRESVELQSHKWKDNSVSHYPISLPNSPRKCNPDLLVRGTLFLMTAGGRWQWVAEVCDHTAVGELRSASPAGRVTGAASH